ncbi:MAG: hypothetical protein DRQ78_11235, partial [Epsilonproteobacteria bacterium]
MIEEHLILKDLKENFTDARTAKVQIDKDISKWIDAYNGKLYGNEQKSRSKVVVRDIQKTVESLKPNLTEPFVGSGKTIDAVPYTAQGEDSSLASEKMLNYQWATQMDRRYIMNMIATNLTKEGTVWCKSEWHYEDKETKVKMSVPIAALNMIPDEYEVLENNGDGSVSIEVTKVEVLKNEPGIKVCRNEHMFPDNTADCPDERLFTIYEYETTLGQMKKDGNFKNLDKLKGYVITAGYNEGYSDTTLGSMREMDNRDFGVRKDLGSKDPYRRKIKLVEFYGLYDVKGNGNLEEFLFVWDKKSEVVVRSELIPTADGEVPFETAAYIEQPFSLWGKPIAELIGDGQQIHTAFMRGFIDNAALANNGQKFIMKGGMDQVNFRRMINGEKHIYMNQNPDEVMKDGAYNEMPSSVFNVYEMVEQLNEGITGLSRMNQGLDAGSASQTATGVSTLTSMAQRRMLDTVRNISNMLRKLFRHQLANSIKFLTDEDWMRITGMQKPQGELGKDFDIRIDLITDAVKQAKIGQYNLMMQNIQYIGEGVQFQAGNMILAKYMDLFDEPALAELIKNQEPPEPSPEEQEGMKLEMDKLRAEVQKLQAEAMKTGAEAQLVGMEGQANAEAKQIELQGKQQEFQLKILESNSKMDQDAKSAEQARAIAT